MQLHGTSSFSPLPGTQPRPRGLFVDLWGSLLEPPADGFCKTFAEVEFTPGAVDALFRASRDGWKIYLIGNEDSVAHGKLPEPTWREIEGEIEDHLAAHGVRLTRNYTCIDDPQDGIEGRQADSVYRLPNTGAFYHAYHNDGVTLGLSWVLGDSTVELAAGWRAGCRTAALESGVGLSDGTFHVEPAMTGPNLAEALGAILRSSHSLLH